MVFLLPGGFATQLRRAMQYRTAQRERPAGVGLNPTAITGAIAGRKTCNGCTRTCWRLLVRGQAEAVDQQERFGTIQTEWQMEVYANLRAVYEEIRDLLSQDDTKRRNSSLDSLTPVGVRVLSQVSGRSTAL
jgi:hypothetical protein